MKSYTITVAALAHYAEPQRTLNSCSVGSRMRQPSG